MSARKTKKETTIQDNWFLAGIIIILAAAIFWLLLAIFLHKPQTNQFIEKINVIDLSYCYACSEDIPETGGDQPGHVTNKDTAEQEEHSEQNPEPGSLDVFDKQIIWRTFSNINLFQDSKYNFREKIAPGSTNTYEFTVRNRTGILLDYDIEFEECNDFNINMKYRLIHEGKYLAGSDDEWVTFNKLNQYAKQIANSTNDTYSLEWQWFDSDNDTEIGENENSNYELRIRVKAIQHIESQND